MGRYDVLKHATGAAEAREPVVSFRRGNPAYRQFSAYIRAEVYRDMKIQLASDDLDLSAGVEEAVTDWIKKRRKNM